MNDIGQDFLNLLSEHANALGVALNEDLEGAAEFAEQRALHLQNIVSEPGFREAVLAERDAIALRVTSDAIVAADEVDQRFLAFVGDAIGFAAKALAFAAI